MTNTEGMKKINGITSLSRTAISIIWQVGGIGGGGDNVTTDYKIIIRSNRSCFEVTRAQNGQVSRDNNIVP
ncbi:hypothetical protein [Paenibacillus sp. EZ-K15]|uniref:hypothetical protein n=1 Tax=Paenibacillus sp. EZ-K15 TaxID=2044275 RepID=UPI000BF40F0D|nr:hypothetical protein [Paenibacillus sp. EZ-K15]